MRNNKSKRTIRLTESDLHRVIKESVRRILSEVRSSRYIDTKNDRFIGNREGPTDHEYVTRDGKLHRHDTWPWGSSSQGWSSSAAGPGYGDELEPIDYDGRYDNDEMFKKFMGQPYNEDRFNKEKEAYKVIEEARELIAWEGIRSLTRRGISSDRAEKLWRGDIHVEDLTDKELECLVS